MKVTIEAHDMYCVYDYVQCVYSTCITLGIHVTSLYGNAVVDYKTVYTPSKLTNCVFKGKNNMTLLCYRHWNVGEILSYLQKYVLRKIAYNLSEITKGSANCFTIS